MAAPIKPTTETREPNLSTEHQRDGDARRPATRWIGTSRVRRGRTRQAQILADLNFWGEGQGTPVQSVVTQCLNGAPRTCGSSTSQAP